jgi:hypothetical protein
VCSCAPGAGGRPDRGFPRLRLRDGIAVGSAPASWPCACPRLALSESATWTEATWTANRRGRQQAGRRPASATTGQGESRAPRGLRSILFGTGSKRGTRTAHQCGRVDRPIETTGGSTAVAGQRRRTSRLGGFFLVGDELARNDVRQGRNRSEPERWILTTV